MITRDEIIRYMTETPLEELGPVLTALADRIYKHRLTHNGFVPREIFEPLISMDGETCSVQVVNEVIGAAGEHIGFALKLREATEVGYQGLFHNTCCSLRMFDTPETALGRDTVDAFGSIPPHDELEFLGVTIHHEDMRRGADVTMMHLRKITTEQLASFVGTWKIFTDDEIRSHPADVVESNWYQLEWVMDPNRPKFADIRLGWPPPAK